MSMVPIPAVLLSLSQPAPMALQVVCYDQLTKKGDLSLVYTWFCMICKHHPEVDSYSTIAFFWTFLKNSGKRKIISLGRYLGSVPATTFCLEGEMARCANILIHGLWLMVHLEAQGFGRSINGKLFKKMEKKYVDRTFRMGRDVKIFVFHLSTQQRMISRGKF